MTDVLSKSAFAVRRNVSTGAVSNWIARGKLTGAALTADGRIAVEEAERQLAAALDPGRGAPAATDADARDSTMLSPLDDLPPSLAQVRLRTETLKLEGLERQAAVERKELILASEARRLWSAELEELLASIELFVLELPVKLGQGREGVDTARREWREFRRRRADQATEVGRAA